MIRFLTCGTTDYNEMYVTKKLLGMVMSGIIYLDNIRERSFTWITLIRFITCGTTDYNQKDVSRVLLQNINANHIIMTLILSITLVTILFINYIIALIVFPVCTFREISANSQILNKLFICGYNA